MALSTLFVQLREPTTKIEGAPVEIPIDAVISRGHSFSAKLSDSAVEDGSVITDHVIKDPLSLQIEGFVSDHPIAFLAGITSGQGLGALTGDVESRSKAAAQALIDAFDQSALLTVTTPLRIYEDMVIERLDMPVDNRTGQALRFTMSLRHVERVTLQKVSIPKLAVPDIAKGAVKRGRKPAATVANRDAADSLLRTGKAGTL